MPKTVEELTDSVLSYGFSALNYRTLIHRWVDEAQRNMFRQAGLRVKHKDFGFTTVVGTNKYEIPSNFSSSISLRNLDQTSEGEVELTRFVDIKEFDNAEAAEGSPTHYIIDNNYIWLYPTPVSARKYSFRYNLIPSAIAEEASSSPTVGEDYYYLVEIYCLYKAFQKEGDVEMANHYKAIYDREMIEFVGYMNTDTKDSVEQIEGAWGGVF